MSLPNPSPPASGRFRYFVAGILVIILVFATAGAVYQSVSASKDRATYPMPGQLIDVGGYKLHVYCIGQGSPVVALDAGLGDSYITWRKVQREIANFARVCSYDRGGLGYSDPSPRSRTSQDIAKELHALLHNAKIAPPYVLVAHSMGGYNVRLFAEIYPDEVAGMVLVDSSHPDQQKRFPPALNDLDAGWIREQEFFEVTMPFGLPRLLGFCGNDAEVRAAECNFHNVRESIAELKSISESAAQTSNTRSLGDLPLAVLSSDPERPQPELPEDLEKPANAAWEQMQNELAQLSTRSSHRVVKNSGHYIQLDQPEFVVDAVRSIVSEVRQAQALPARGR